VRINGRQEPMCGFFSYFPPSLTIFFLLIFILSHASEKEIKRKKVRKKNLAERREKRECIGPTM
jgi:hypothetical protein